MKRTASRKQCRNHLEITIRTDKKENGGVLEREIKRAILKWNRSLDLDISYEIITIDDRNNFPAARQNRSYPLQLMKYLRLHQ